MEPRAQTHSTQTNGKDQTGSFRANRAWGAFRRVFYALAWPAFALLRFGRLLGNWPRGVPELPSRAKLAPTLLAGFVADAAGQAVGFLSGAGDAGVRMLRFEFDRAAHVRASERALLEAGA